MEDKKQSELDKLIADMKADWNTKTEEEKMQLTKEYYRQVNEINKPWRDLESSWFLLKQEIWNKIEALLLPIVNGLTRFLERFTKKP